MPKKRSTKVSNRVIMMVLVLAVAVAVLGTFASLMDLGGNSGITGATSVDNEVLKESTNDNNAKVDVEINQTETIEENSP